MRLFLALWPPAEAIAHAQHAVAPVRTSFPDLRWIPADRWHLTLAFYGEVTDRDAGRLEARLGRQVARHAAMTLRFKGSGRFPKRAVWLGVSGDVRPLQALAQRVARDDRPYRPHLTVARLRGRTDPSGAVEALAEYEGPKWEAAEVALVRSHLGPSPTYETFATFPFATFSEPAG